MGNRFDGRRDFEAAEIGASKHVSCIRWSGEEPYVNRNSSV
jgi:hypothetical protein